MFTQPFAVPALALFVVAIPLIIGIVPRNRLYGVRTKRTLADDRVWYQVNRVGGAAVMIASLMYAIVAATWPYTRSANDFGIWAVHLAGFALPLLLGLTFVGWYAKQR